MPRDKVGSPMAHLELTLVKVREGLTLSWRRALIIFLEVFTLKSVIIDPILNRLVPDGTYVYDVE